MAVKSKPGKRNKYRDKDGNVMEGYVLSEVLDKPVEILAKRNYTWGKFTGLAVKVRSQNGTLAVIEITAKTPIQALNNPNLPKMPFEMKFVERVSKNGYNYYSIRLLDETNNNEGDEKQDEILPF